MIRWCKAGALPYLGSEAKRERNKWPGPAIAPPFAFGFALERGPEVIVPPNRPPTK